MRSSSTCLIFVTLTISAATLGSHAMACAQSVEIERGMTQDEVERRLGQPDARSVLDGKVLRPLREGELPALQAGRVVYIYEKPNLRVWFKAGIVTGATRNGVSILGMEGAESPADDELTPSERGGGSPDDPADPVDH